MRAAHLALVLVWGTLAGCPTRGPEAADRGVGRPIAILMIGDGMGRGQLEVASRFEYGRPGGLALEGLPVRGEIETASPSGITDSAAAGTAFACGAFTVNGRVGLDLNGDPVENVVELVHGRGMSAGIVSTALLPHATNAVFTAHVESRHELNAIAAQQVRESQPEVLLGGGSRYFLPEGEGSSRDDAGLLGDIDDAGYVSVSTAGELRSAVAAAPERLFGTFSAGHLPYVRERDGDSEVPTLVEMTRAALEVLDRDEDGFFLMVEGGRIDHAGHGNLVEDVVAETLEFDAAVALVRDWAVERSGRDDDVLVIVTGDHETGGLTVVGPKGAGEVSDVTWRWGKHTGDVIDVFAMGPGSAVFGGVRRDHRWVHAAVKAHLEGGDVVRPLGPAPQVAKTRPGNAPVERRMAPGR